MNEAVLERTRAVRAEAAQGSPAMRVVPLMGPSATEPAYRLLERDVLEKVRVSEVSESGSVPELLVRNDLDERVFLMDGQELVGAKQNRVLNTDVLVPPKSEVRIPVSCVEQGRWAYRGETFSPGKSLRFSTRRRKVERVHQSLQAGGTHDADQLAVWDEVAETIDTLSVTSDTAALSDAYAARQQELDALRETLRLPDNAVGVALYRGGKLQGIDLFDRHATLAYFWRSLIDSYGLDHLGAKVEIDATEPDLPADLTDALDRGSRGDWQSFPAPGEGEDLRLRHESLSGSALLWEGRAVIHLQLFPQQQEDQPARRRAARRRPRLRRRYLRDRPTQ